MNNLYEKIYTLGMIEFLFNGSARTSLGDDYVLQYKTGFTEVGGGEMGTGDGSLYLAAKLFNNKTNSVEWGRIYCKPLIKGSGSGPQVNDQLKDKIVQIMGTSSEEKMKFILKPETLIFKKPYTGTSFIDPELASFFENLNMVADDGYPVIRLNGRFPNKARPGFYTKYDEVLAAIQQKEVMADKTI